MKWLAALILAGVVAAWPRALPAQVIRPQLVATFPHDSQAFTQGLLLHQGRFYESTGLLGSSSLRRVTPATGVVERSVPLASELFGEGLALAGDRLIQLTWQNQIALVYDLDFNPLGSFDYTGEGWGLCHDGARLIMSDGSSRLFFRDPTTFALLGDVEVRRAGTPVTQLNELECVGSLVFANVWQTDMIVRIDPATGNVLDTIDASGLLTPQEAAGADVLNGIAHDPASGHFYITGKLWPKLFEVRFEFPGGPDGGAGAGGAGAGGAGMGGASTPDSGRPDASLETGGHAGAAGGAAAGGSGGSPDAALAGGAKAGSGSSSGCGCRTPLAPAPSSALGLSLAFGALVAARRRSRRVRHGAARQL